MKRVMLIALLALLTGCDALIPPQPLPVPLPVPPIVDPQPVPIGKVATIYVLEETAERTPELAILLADEWWHSSGIAFQILDKDLPEAAPVVKAVGSIKLPAIVLTDASNKLIYRGELPKDISGVKALIARAK